MPETITRRSKVKTDRPSTKVLKQVVPTTTTTTEVVEKPKTTQKYTTERSSVISETKIKKVLDENRINKYAISVIQKIKAAMESNKEVKNELSDKDLEIVSEYIDKHRKRLESEEKSGKSTSTNEVSLRAFIDQKYKFKKTLSTYFGIICDLIVEEIMSASMEHILSINKVLINTNHIVRSQLEGKLLYPLYCNLPSFINQTDLSTDVSDDTTTGEESSTNVDEDELKVNKYFMGNIRTIFINLRGKDDSQLKIQKKYQQFISTLLVEFLDRIIHPLMVIVNNNSRNRVVVQNTAATIIEIFMSDYSWETNKYPELLELIQQRWHRS